MNLAALLEKSARRFGDRPAIALGHELFSSYQNTAERVARLAGGLLKKEASGPGTASPLP